MTVKIYTVERETDSGAAVPLRERVSAHLRIARLDHSVKQVFILPGIVTILPRVLYG